MSRNISNERRGGTRRSSSFRKFFIGVCLFMLFLYMYLQLKEPSLVVNGPINNLRTQVTSSSNEKVTHYIFTSTCSLEDTIQAEILAYSARKAGVKHGITRILYNCNESTAKQIVSRHKVNIFLSNWIEKDDIVDDKKDVLINPHAISEWLQSHNSVDINNLDYIVLLDLDTIITKPITIYELKLLSEVNEYVPGYGQGPTWFQQFNILPKETLEEVVGKNSPCSNSYFDWQYYTVSSPYAIQKHHLKRLISSYSSFTTKLPRNLRHFAYTLAAAHHDIKHEFLSFRLTDIFSSWENWNFDSYLTTNPCDINWALNLKITDFPLTMKLGEYTLDRWKDGKNSFFSKKFLPKNLLNCDSQLLEIPSLDLYYLASHTKGDERISIPERKRHILASCTCFQMVNEALIDYKSEICINGYNNNKNIHFINNISTNSNGFNTEEQSNEIKMESSDDFHIVYLSDCSPEEELKSEMMYFSSTKVGYTGKFTRILAGCSEKQLQKTIQKKISYPVFYHILPFNYLKTDHAPALNHWLMYDNILFSNDTKIVIIKSDFVWLKSLEIPFGFEQGKIVVHTEALVNWTSISSKTKEKICASEKECFLEDKTNSINSNLTFPCVIYKKDLISISKKYLNISELLKEDNLDDKELWLRNNIAFGMAVAWKRFDIIQKNLVVKGKDISNEFVQGLKLNPCEIHYRYNNHLDSVASFLSIEDSTLQVDPKASTEIWSFSIASIPKDIYSCDSKLLHSPPSSLWTDPDFWSDTAKNSIEALRTAFLICFHVNLVNDAVLAYKKLHCPSGYNSHKSLKLINAVTESL